MQAPWLASGKCIVSRVCVILGCCKKSRLQNRNIMLNVLNARDLRECAGARFFGAINVAELKALQARNIEDTRPHSLLLNQMDLFNIPRRKMHSDSSNC